MKRPGSLNQFTMFFRSLLLLLVLAIISGEVWGDDRPHADPGMTPNTSERLTYRSSGYRFKTIPLDTKLPCDDNGHTFEHPDFDDSGFEPGTAPFVGGGGGLGEKDCPLRQTVQTEWPTETQLLLRRSIFIPDGATGVRIMVSVDNDAVCVFFNGKSVPHSSISHTDCPILDEFRIDVPQELVQLGQDNLVTFHVTDRRPIDDNETFFDARILAELPLAKCLGIANDLVTFEPIESTFETSSDTIGCSPEETLGDAFVGQFSFEARLTNTGNNSLTGLMVEVAELTNGNVLQNADGGPGGVGARLTVPVSGGGDYADGILAPEESVDVHLIICLKDEKSFRFFVDVSGTVLDLSIPLQSQFYFQNFESVCGFKITDAGFTGHFWKLDTTKGNKFMVSVPPGESDKCSEAISPSLSFCTDEMLKGGFSVQYELQFSGEWDSVGDSESDSPEPLESSETSVDILDCEGQRLLTLEFRPNPPADTDNFNLILTDRHAMESSAKTETVTPFGIDSNAGTVNLKIAFPPTSSDNSVVEVFYGENGNFRDTPLIVHEFQGSIQVDRLKFRHKQGTGRKDDRVQVDNISVRSFNVPLLFPTYPDNRFDRELLISDGSNINDVFDAGSYFQASFRLSHSIGGEGLFGDWDKFLDLVHSVKNVADNIHGVPLLISKSEFIVLQPNMEPEAKTFFMAAFAEDTVVHQDITILSSPAFQLSDDLVENIELQIEGTTLHVDPFGNTPFRFSDKGKKIVQVTVRFASGFEGKNMFRITVEPVSNLP